MPEVVKSCIPSVHLEDVKEPPSADEHASPDDYTLISKQTMPTTDLRHLTVIAFFFHNNIVSFYGLEHAMPYIIMK